MASALQCPACGYKHRLSALTGEPIFTCAQCGRLLKTPTEYRRPEPSGPSEPPRPSTTARVQRGGSAARDQTGVLPATSGAPVATRPPARRPMPRANVTIALPLRILAWVFAVGIGAYIVRYLARVTGWLTGDSLIDVITGSGIGRYFRLFALVPFWALASAGLATLFIEGGRWWMARRGTRPMARPARRPTAERPPAARPPGPGPRPPAPTPNGADTRSPSDAAGTPRARRIPRREIPSEPRSPSADR